MLRRKANEGDATVDDPPKSISFEKRTAFIVLRLMDLPRPPATDDFGPRGFLRRLRPLLSNGFSIVVVAAVLANSEYRLWKSLEILHSVTVYPLKLKKL